eukprot:2016446-Alexandrium_andersonii.AAC.1
MLYGRMGAGRMLYGVTVVFHRHDVSYMGHCVDRSMGLELVGVCTAWALARLPVLPAMVRPEVELAWAVEWHALLL